MAVDVAAARRLFTRDEYHRMADAGILKPTDRVELAGRAIVSVQSPVALSDDSEPQPDLKILRRRPVPYKDVEASAADVLLVIEVAETSLRYDRSTKLALYAEFGISEYWVIDCGAETVEVHRTAAADGYRDVTRVAGNGSVALQSFPDVVLTAQKIFA